MYFRCYSTMVANQLFLHALTGKSADDVRKAAVDIVKDLNEQLKSEQHTQRKINLLCARGFAGHLLGDTLRHL